MRSLGHTRQDRILNRAGYLTGRAVSLRKVAKTIDVRSIRDRVLALAEECEQLARLVEKATAEKPRRTMRARSAVRSPSRLRH